MRCRHLEMKKLFLQAIKFIGFSGIGWILDFVTFTVLGIWSENYAFNNIVSSLVGVTFVFIFATRAVFKNNSKIPLKVKYVIYLVYQFALILLISWLLAYISNFIVTKSAVDLLIKFSNIISKILVTPITMALNFFVMKGVIEKI